MLTLLLDDLTIKYGWGITHVLFILWFKSERVFIKVIIIESQVYIVARYNQKSLFQKLLKTVKSLCHFGHLIYRFRCCPKWWLYLSTGISILQVKVRMNYLP